MSGKSNTRTQSENEKKRELFEEELSPHLNIIYRTSLSLTGNERDAEDLVQDALFRAYRFFDKYEPGTNFRAWVLTILKNLFINKYRKRKREPTKIPMEDVKFLLEDDDNSKTAKIVTSTDDISLSDYIYELDDDVYEVLNELPDDFMIPVILADIEDFPYKEIAEIMEIPLGTVRSRIFRARAFIREKLQKYAKEMGYI